MRRRDFITLLGGAAAAWPLAARAQQGATPVIGYLGTAETDVLRLRAFRQGLTEAGFVEGRNVAIEYRWIGTAPAAAARVREMIAELIRRQVRVIVGNQPTAASAKTATSTIPIVFSGAVDPVQVGMVASLNRPGANVTGVLSMGAETGGKLFSLMHELLPSAVRYGLLIQPVGLIIGSSFAEEIRSAVAGVGASLEVLTAGTIGEVDNAFASLVAKKVEALFVAPSAFFTTRRVQLATLATRHAIPAMYIDRAFAEVGGLMSYGARDEEVQRQVGLYVGRVLKGEKPADLPVLQPTRFELVINAGTAKALGLTVPPTLLAIADEVIE
jgi:putative ABC transport system substrate-binding protein